MLTVQPDINPYSIQGLCPDILSEIFTFCLPDVPKEPRHVHPISTRKAPLLLCFVCSSWRSLAIATPRLWQTLHFGVGFTDKLMNDTESITSGIRTWLDRSGTLPLFIRGIFYANNPKSDKATKCRLILEILSQEISRWESFEIDAERIWVTPPHFGISPMLRTCNISESPIDRTPFTAAPRLKRLGLFSPCLKLTCISGIPWDQLVELSITETQPISMILEVIQRCPQLESLSLVVKEGNEDGSLSFRSITQHDTLRKLKLTMPPYINGVTDRLTLPALTDLSLDWTCRPMSGVEAKFRCSLLVAFFTRSNCELKKFALSYPEFGPGELLECLSHRSCQTLTRLVIFQDKSSPLVVDEEVLIRLTYSYVDDSVPLCPKLSFLELRHCYSSGSSPDLGRMIHSRCFGRAHDVQLRTLRLFSHWTAISKEDRMLLEIAKNGGLDMSYP